MVGTHRLRRSIAFAAILLLAACRSPFGSRADPGRAPPPPAPGGALYGRVLRADGRAASGATVEVAQPRPGDPRLGEAVAKRGCATAAACAEGAPGTPGASVLTNRQGAFVLPERAVHPGLRSVVTAVLPPLDRAQWTGPETSAVLEDGTHVGHPQEVPDLFSWEPRLFFASGGGDLRLRWPALDVGLQTRAVEYTVEAVLAATGLPVAEVTGPQESTAAVIDARPFEDAAYQVVVVARTAVVVDGGKVLELSYRSGSRQVPVRAGPAPSRGRPCLTDDLGGNLHEIGPCPLTDGDFGQHQQVSFPACPEDGSDCVQTHQRLCVNLGASRPVSLVVYRTHFPYVQAVVELSTDGRHFLSPGSAPADRGTEVVSVPIDPPQPASIVCVRGPFTGPALREISVW